MTRVLLDINVLLDLFLHRQPWSADAAAIWKAQRQKKFNAQLAAFSVPTLYYLVSQAADRSQALSIVDACLATLTIIPVSQETLELARKLALDDYEDGLQLACAVQANLDFIVTRDPKDYKASPVPVISAAELRAQLRLGTGKKSKGKGVPAR